MRTNKLNRTKRFPAAGVDCDTVELPVSPVVAAALQDEVSPVPWRGGGRLWHAEDRSLDAQGRGKSGFAVRCQFDGFSEAWLSTDDGRGFVLKVSHDIYERGGQRYLPSAVETPL